MTDVLPAKREHARSLGADDAVDATAEDVVDRIRHTLEESADVVFDCVAVQPTITQAISLASKGGTVVVVGVPAREVTVPLPLIQDHQIRIQGSATYIPEDYDESIRLLQAGAIHTSEMVTAVHTLNNAADAFAQSASGEHLKVLIVANDTTNPR